MNDDVQAALRGAVGGVAATTTMSAAMAAAHRAGALGEPPPRKITRRAEAAVGVATDRRTLDALSWLGHYGYGAVMGALFGVLQRRLRAPRLVAGVVWGLIVWAASYLGWLPAAGLHPAAHRDRPDRTATMVASHVVYGATLGWAGGRRRDRRAEVLRA